MINKFFQLPGFILAAISVFILIISGFFCWYYERNQSSYEYIYLNNPTRYAGTQICLGYRNITQKYADEVMSIDSRGRKYYFIMDTSLVNINQYYSISGTLTTDGKIVVEDFQIHPDRKLKRLISLLSLVIILFLAKKFIRFDSKALLLLLLNNEMHFLTHIIHVS